MSGFKSYKIRDGVHIPSKKYKEGWDAIFSDKPKKDNMSKKLYTSDEDRMMQDKNLTWSEPAIITNNKGGLMDENEPKKFIIKFTTKTHSEVVKQDFEKIKKFIEENVGNITEEITLED